MMASPGVGPPPSPAVAAQPNPNPNANANPPQGSGQALRAPIMPPQRNLFQSPNPPAGYVNVAGPPQQRFPQSHHMRMGPTAPPFSQNVRPMVPPPPPTGPQGMKRSASAMNPPPIAGQPTKGMPMNPMGAMGPPPGPTHQPTSKKKKKLSDKILPQKVRDLVPESQAYMDLLAFERKLDFTIMRKRLDIQEALKRPMKQKRKLRIFISNTFYPGKPEGDANEEPSVPSWELRVEGRLLEDPNAPKADQSKLKRKFSSFFKSLVIELDKDLYGPDNHLVEWHRTPTTTETDGFQVKRPGDKNVRCTILLLLDYQPLQFKLDPRLARLLGIHTQTRPVIINALWQYIKTHKLQDPHEREYINCDKYLEQIFQCPRMKFAEIPSRLHHLLHPPDPIVINHLISVEGPDMKKTSCYDIDVEVDDPLKIQMNNFLLSTASQQEIQSLDNKIHETVETINQLKTNREFFLSFSTDPQQFINKWLISQMRDLKVILILVNYLIVIY